MSAHDDELPSLDTADLARVTGGAGFDFSSMLPLMMIMMRNRAQAAPVMAPPAPAPWQPKITVNGVPAQVTPGPNGSFTYTTPTTNGG